jgi:hypothetical protein
VDNYNPAAAVNGGRGVAERGAIEINGQTPGPVVNEKPKEKKK